MPKRTRKRPDVVNAEQVEQVDAGANPPPPNPPAPDDTGAVEDRSTPPPPNHPKKVPEGFTRAPNRGTLRVGHWGPRVQELTELLRGNRIAVKRGPSFTRWTAQSVREFQNRARLPRTGEADAKTIEALRARFKKGGDA